MNEMQQHTIVEQSKDIFYGFLLREGFRSEDLNDELLIKLLKYDSGLREFMSEICKSDKDREAVLFSRVYVLFAMLLGARKK